MKNKNTSLALSLAAIVVGMAMLAYASVPLYRLFCETTGFGGRATQTEKALPAQASSRVVTVRFDANTSPQLVWDFKPAINDMQAPVGKEMRMYYTAKNIGSERSVGTATFNVTPVKAGKYFNKIQCFCFNEQPLDPGQLKEMDVTYFIDPAINDDRDLDDVHTITLSYTFFPLKK